MSLRTQACEALGATIQERLNLATVVEIIAAPPSKPAEYPACAIIIDRTDIMINDDFIPVDEDGDPLVGPDATMDLPADWARFDENTLIYRVGRYMMHGRIFVATRHPSQRTEFEDEVFSLFFVDDLAPGRIVFDIDKPKVLGRPFPWSWPVAAYLDDTTGSTWTAEYAFDERLWSWTKVDIDVDIMMPRNAPMIKKLVLVFDADVTQPLIQDTDIVTDLDEGADDETVQVDQAGDISAYP